MRSHTPGRRTPPAILAALCTAALGLSLLSPPRAALAQEVRPGEIRDLSLGLRGIEREAERQGRGDWPVPRDGQPGTQVILSADLSNADIQLATRRSFGLEKLLAEARGIAAALDLPRTDFITYAGKRTTDVVDLEFNDYLRREGRTRTAFTLDLGRLRTALEASRLPRPVVLCVDADPKEFVGATLTAGDGAKAPAREITSRTFFGLAEVPEGARLEFRAEMPWYGPLAALCFTGVVLLPLATPWQLARARRRKELEQAEKDAASDAVPDPAVVQAGYNKQPPQWLFLLGMPVVMGALFLSGGFSKGLGAAALTLSALGVPFSVLPVGMAAAFGASALGSWLWDRSVRRREGTPATTPADPDEPPRWTLTASLAPLMLVMPLMFLLMPGVSPVRIPSEYVRPVLFYGILPFSVLAPLLGSWLASRATHTRLAPDDPTHRMVTEMASAAGVPVKRVVVRRAKELNAYASVLGTVGLTSALLRRMDPDEVRAVVAHELGHHKARDPRRHLLFSLLFTLAALGAWFALRSYLESRVNLSTEAKALLNSPIFAIFILPVLQSLAMGRTHRRAEEAADRFAVDATGDAELVVRALRKLHTLNATPHTLKPSDEALSTHPSLANRIEAIRRYAAEKGSPADG